MKPRKFSIFLATFWVATFWLGGTLLPAQEQNIVAEPDLTLFTFMAALNAAGYDAGADRMELTPIRKAVREDLAGLTIPSLAPLRQFYKEHKLADPAKDLSQYISVALLSSGAPRFELELGSSNLPPDAYEVQEIAPLVAAFYEQANIPALFDKYLPAMERDSEPYQKLLARVIQETSGYLRVETGGYMGERFAVYPNFLGPPGLTDARSYGDNYYVIATPSGNLPQAAIEHEWLHYLVDSYVWKYPSVVESKSGLLPIAQRARALDPAFRSNFSLLLTESLIRAIQARLSSKDERTQLGAVQDAAEEGVILTPYFYEALKEFEKQPVGMRLYFPDMLEALDVGKERNRLSEVEFRAAADAPVREAQWSPLEQMLREGQQHLARAEYEQAQAVYESLSKQYGARAEVLYGLALVASQRKDPEHAVEYFKQAAAIASDPRMKAWSHIYVGRLLDLNEERDAAVAEYSAALNAGDPAADTRTAAEQGLKAPFSKPGGNEAPAQQAPPETYPAPRFPLGRESGSGN